MSAKTDLRESEVLRLGQSIPAETPHAISVSLPTWRSNVGYEEGQEWVTSRMTAGYPRFFVHPSIRSLAERIATRYASLGEMVMLFPCHAAAARCLSFMRHNQEPYCRLVDLESFPEIQTASLADWLRVSVVFYPEASASLAKSFWQHTGEGISSRRAEYLTRLFDEGILVEHRQAVEKGLQQKGPRRYRKDGSQESIPIKSVFQPDSDSKERLKFIEERYGRDLNLSVANQAKQAIKRRISGSLTNEDKTKFSTCGKSLASEKARVSENDVYLYQGGMNAIYTTHRLLLKARGQLPSICFGFPYIDTLKVLEKFGPGCLFYGRGDSADLDDLEKQLVSGRAFLALFCEFPSNPLLHSPDLQRIRRLADAYGFPIVVDETIGNFLNVDTLTYADILTSSLTKIFSGDCDVMGGSVVLNPKLSFYETLKATWSEEYEDHYWPEDAIRIERNSRDFASRIVRINENAEFICDILSAHSRIKKVYYPKISPSRQNYDACRTKDGGYGGLISATFYSDQDAITFYDAINTEKGPSLGTNFTLSSPFVLLAHYKELDWAARHGVEANLVRFSVGLEQKDELSRTFAAALDKMDSVT